MCVVCQGAVPHPLVIEIPMYVTLLEVGFIWLLGWWMIFKMRVISFAKEVYTVIKNKIKK